MSTSSYITRFEAYLLTERRASRNTVCAYKKDIEQLMEFLDARSVTCAQVTKNDLQEFLEAMLATQVKASTRARKIAAIKSFYNYLYDHYGIPNVAREISIPKQDQLLPHYLSRDEVQKLFAVADQDLSVFGRRNSVMVHILYGTGLRVSELVCLKISDIQFDMSVLRVSCGKGSKQRLVPLHESLVKMLQNYIRETHGLLVRTEKSFLETDYLFPHKEGTSIKPITRQAVWVIIKRLSVAAYIKRAISPHQLRHSLATHMLGEGVDLRSLQLLLGHENLSTVQIYTHVETSALRTIYDKKHPRSR
jgi:site-specific recombinase XerD